MASSATSPQSIRTVLKNLKTIRRMAFDIGQSVVKIAYTATVAKKRTTQEKKLVNDSKHALRLYCIQVRLDDFEAVLDYIAENGCIATKKATFASTSSTHHVEQMIVEKLGLELHKVKEMDCLVRGTNFLMRNIEAESFTYDHHNETCRYHFETIRPSMICPYLLVNVGTGVSVFKVDGDGQYERVGGSSLGGGCFFGLGNLLTSEVDLDEMMRMAEDGDHRQFDILVSDIYGGKFTNLGLSGDLIAGSFGKCARKHLADDLKNCPDFNKNVMRSLLLMISNSIGQFAFLYAQREKTNRIYFDGFLIRNHAIIMRTISFAIEFWSEGTHKAHFLRHEGYTSAIGAYLSGASFTDPMDTGIGAGYESERLSWREYYSGCSELGRFVPTAPLSMGFTAGVLELECAEIVLRPFPLLAENLQVYKPDVADLNLDSEAREFWLKTFEKSVDNVTKKALESQRNCSTAAQRVQIFREKFLKQLMVIRERPFAYGNSNVRNLLDLREQLLNEQDFDDSYLNIADDSVRLFRVSKGLLAGNVFDWGAQKVVEMMESSEGLSFDAAVSSIPGYYLERPWLIDMYEDFKHSLDVKPYRCAVIFVDNSGADFVLGVIPFARELIRRGSKVG
ncbi:pantothenate kinase [Oesophagostomum dentatum]|uniref:4'-phosphopantetheine phosphatase n=1 Tax=Oesophagostomum dentatum TaxID=61180 RepID=A0A0B1TEQ3_OESDE|nr:pantothenate kinase [Oesophagostomum dentatum]